jgi:hypothetical protein
MPRRTDVSVSASQTQQLAVVFIQMGIGQQPEHHGSPLLFFFFPNVSARL